MSEAKGVVYTAEELPLAGIEETIEEAVSLFGGSVTSREAGRIVAALPRRRAVAAAGDVQATLRWDPAQSEGELTIEAGEEILVARGKRIAMLLAGVIGAMLFLLWPFFPNLGAVVWIGGAIAIAVYFLALKTTESGLVWSVLQRIVDVQLAKEEEEQEPGPPGPG